MMTPASKIDRAQARASEKCFAHEIPLKIAAQFSWGLSAIYILTLANCFSCFQENGGQLQFVNGIANILFLVAALLLPAAILIIRLASPYTKLKWWFVSGLVPITFLSGYFALLTVAFSIPPPALLKSFSMGQQTIRCFRVSEFLSSSVEIQQERPVIPGIIWSEPLYRESGAINVEAKIKDSHHLECIFSVDKDIDGGYAMHNVMVKIP